MDQNRNMLRVFPFEFRETVWRNRFVRAWRMQHRWAHNLKKIENFFYDPLHLSKFSRSTKITYQTLNGDGQVTHIQAELQTDAFTSTMF